MKVSLKLTLKTVVFLCVFTVFKMPTSWPVMSVFMMSLPMEFTPHTEFITIDQRRKKKERTDKNTQIYTLTVICKTLSFHDEQQ